MQDYGSKPDNFDAVAVTYNDYLRDIENWDETELPKYRSKVMDHTIGTFFRIVLGLIVSTLLYAAVVGISSMFFSIETMGGVPYQIAAIALIHLISFIIYFRGGKKAIRKLIDSCHGEIAHNGSPFIRKIKVCLVLSLILFIGVVAYVIFKYMNGEKIEGGYLEILSAFMYVPAFVLPFARFLGFIVGRRDIPICPVCGRYNTVYKQQIGEQFGQTYDGEHTEYDYQTERVGTRYTTTTYTDGSKNTTSSPIYESVRYTEVYQDYSALVKYVYLCSECSYCELSLEEKKWKIRSNRYRG